MLQDATLQHFSAAASSHMVPLCFSDVESSRLSIFRPSEWSWQSWQTLAGHRALCRLCAGLLDMVHLQNKRSVASIRHCCFCVKKIRTSYTHALGECTVSQDTSFPQPWQNLSLPEGTKAILCSTPGDDWFPAAVALAVKLEQFVGQGRGHELSLLLAHTTAPCVIAGAERLGS